MGGGERRARSAGWGAGLAAALACAAGTARAGEADEPWRPTTSGPFVTLTAPLTPAGRVTLQPILFLTAQRGAFDADGQYAPLSGNSLGASAGLFAEVGFSERFAAGGQVNLLASSRMVAGQQVSSSGPGDAVLFARWSVPLPARPWLPDLSLFAQVKLPLGRAEGLAPALLGTDARGTGTWDGTAGLDLTKFLRPLVLHLDLFFSASLEATLDGVPTRPGPAFSWAASAELPLPLSARTAGWALMVELSGRAQAGTRVAGADLPGSQVREVTVGAGVELLFGPELQLLVGYQRTLWGANVPALDAFGVTLVPTL